MLPDVPTVAEAGLPGMEGAVFFGVMTTAGTPPEVVARLNKAFNEILAEPATRKKLLELGFILVGGSAEAYGARVASETARWRKVIQDAHISRRRGVVAVGSSAHDREEIPIIRRDIISSPCRTKGSRRSARGCSCA